MQAKIIAFGFVLILLMSEMLAEIYSLLGISEAKDEESMAGKYFR